MNSTNTTKRLFNRTLNHERIEITNYYTGEFYSVFFRKNDRSTTPQGKVRLFYPVTTNIKIGTIFSLYNKGKYLVVSQDSDENSVYYTSLAIRCDETFKVKHNNTLVSVPFVLSSEVYDISENSTISIIDGSIIAYTGLTEETKDITGTYNVFGGTYQVKNSFIRSGLIYYYLKRTANETNTLTYELMMLLIAIDGSFQGYYTEEKYVWIHKHWLVDVLDLPEFYECEKRHTKDEFKEIQKKYNIHKGYGKITLKNGYLSTDIDLEMVNDVLGWETDIVVELPTDGFKKKAIYRDCICRQSTQ